MHSAYRTPTVRATTRPLREIEADLLLVPVFTDDDLDGLEGLDAAAGGRIAAARSRGEFKGTAYEAWLTPLSGWKTERVALVGAGARADLSTERVRRLATIGGLAARQRRLTRLAIVCRTVPAVSAAGQAQAAAEGAIIASFDGNTYKTGDGERTWLEGVELFAGDGPEIAPAVARGGVLGEATNMARALANEPGNTLTPRVFADRARDAAVAAGLQVDVLDEQRMAELNMGLLLGVARGSAEPPRLIVLRHEPAAAAAAPVLGLIGKGITFDTGGISIKPADNMDKMKDDMSGGAAVLAAMTAIARLQLPVRCVGVIPCTENMPGGRAVKPGDVLVSAEGKTVEVLNTDAEGRMVLGDALWYARRLGATHLVDVATLTGACVVALGKTTSGLFGTPDGWRDAVLAASARAGDRSWPMPLFDDYRDQFKSEIADFSNTGGRPGGAITGALFIKEFAGDRPWAHLDIAGTAWAEESRPYQPKGATGVAVRTLVELALAADGWSKL